MNLNQSSTNYSIRAGKKDKSKYKEDLQKAIAYLQKEIESCDSGE